MKKIFNKKFNLPLLHRFSHATGKDVPRIVSGLGKSEKIIYWIFFWIFAVSSLGALYIINSNILVELPARGGSFTEGVVGRPGFINPILAISDTDKDLSLLVYSGLLRDTAEGELIPDLAKSYTISEDKLVYTVVLRDNLTWHDGEPITTDDIIFTIERIRDSSLKSPLSASWEGVAVNKIDERTINFELAQQYSLFPRNLTTGILPEHIWSNFSVEDFTINIFNTDPIGSGPYEIKKIKRDNAGIAFHYDLESFKNYALGEPYISEIRIKFFGSEEDLLKAYEREDIDSIGGISPSLLSDQDIINVKKFPLTRIFAVFLNQNESKLFTLEEVRKALSMSADRQIIIDNVLLGFGTPVGGPLPPGSIGYIESPNRITDKNRAKNILIDNGWELNEDGVFEKTIDKQKTTINFTLATANVPELRQAAEILRDGWREIGINAEVQSYDRGDLKQSIIRPRDYEALLFGEIKGRDPDPFAFWHSSQRLDPGLNVAMYANITSDNVLEEARTTHDKDERIEKYAEFQKEVEIDVPAVFLYSPDYLYVAPKSVINIKQFPVTIGSERFTDIYKWYIKADKVWSFLQ